MYKHFVYTFSYNIKLIIGSWKSIFILRRLYANETIIYILYNGTKL